MADIFEEVNEELRQQKLQAFWKENGPWIIGGAILAVVMTGSLSFWNNWKHERNVAATTELVRVLNEETDVAKLEDYAQSTSTDHAALARLFAAGRYAREGNTDKAVELYAEIEQSRGVGKLYRDLAKLFSVGLRLQTGDAAQLEQELAYLAKNNSAWRWSAQEMQALLAAREQNFEKAVDILTQLSGDNAAPQDMRTRAFTLRDIYMIQMSKKTDDAESSTGREG